MSEKKIAAIAVPSEATDALAKPLAETNSVGNASVAFYRAALDAAGIDPESLTFAESVEVTRRLYAISADYRRSVAEVAKAEREAARAAEREAREAKRKDRLVAERAKLEAKLAKLANS
jgi:hypothetical protein